MLCNINTAVWQRRLDNLLADENKKNGVKRNAVQQTDTKNYLHKARRQWRIYTKNGNKKSIRSHNIKDVSNSSWTDNEEVGRGNMKITGHIDRKLEGKAAGNRQTSLCE